jgi:hypothetical protein
MDPGYAETVKYANCMGREGMSVPGLVEGKGELQWRSKWHDRGEDDERELKDNARARENEKRKGKMMEEMMGETGKRTYGLHLS